MRRKKGRQTLAAVELNPQIFSDIPSKSSHQVCALCSVLLQKRITIDTSLKQLHPEIPSVLEITTIKLLDVCYWILLYVSVLKIYFQHIVCRAHQKVIYTRQPCGDLGCERGRRKPALRNRSAPKFEESLLTSSDIF